MRTLTTLNSNWKSTAFFVGLFWLISVAASAQVTTTDTLCVESQDVTYGITGADPTSTFAWGFASGYTPLGTIDNSVSSNNSTIEIDWGSADGSTRIYAIEQSADGCYGDTVYLDIILNPLPTIALTGDQVCENDSSSVNFTLTGTAPWDIVLSDGTNTYNYQVSNANATVKVAAFAPGTTSISVVSVSDANGCSGDVSGVTPATVTINAKPTTGGIFHY
ncbi:MAG: hypothetical protein EP346_08105 [Bacteroidetes bacterium]|nr:MAG: hypothetical protein EP346_08105 [Bacteroidota bacterium]